MNKEYLEEKLGRTIQAALKDDVITEIMRNSDGVLWFVHREQGVIEVGHLSEQDALSFAHSLAQYSSQYLNAKKPYLDSCLPFHGERINITIPPLSEGVCFNIRKRAKQIYTLSDYVDQGIITKSQSKLLNKAIRERKNILVSGGPGTGKTTLTNALLNEINEVVSKGHRVLLLEQVPELQCKVVNCKPMVTTDYADMRCLLWIAMRNSPDRIIVGEVRDGACLDMLKAWNTGCPGGIATIHANSAIAALQRVMDLSLEATNHAPCSLMGEALDVIVQLNLDPSARSGRRVSGIIRIDGYDRQAQEFVMHNMEE